ncbi:MAG: pyridine nucleotide-disulfide oxidoreductase [Desulfobacterales bacterium C00003060]|nr:MAG: pyridine nucleotide-disulfide oxidoreductase [Desulfobacterales bacterium C00003060]OEU84591.1 MAG: pyridine nucleotide-disulfide oxidoreductase [Desulfobacterales bacterium S5133MH4]
MPQNVVIVGAVALGPKAACRFKRLEPESRVIMVDRANLISYGGCGIPYFISGDVSTADELRSTSFHMLRDEKFFRDTKDIDVMTNTEAISIDREKKTVLVQSTLDRKKQELSYDKLVLGTGSRPRCLPIPGSQLQGVFSVTDLNKAIAIKTEVAEGKVGKAVIIGAGAIGLEIAESLADLWGIETHVVEIMDQVLPGIVSPNMARMVQHHMEENDISFYLGEKVERFEGETRIEKVVTDKRILDADMVIMAVGVTPNSDLAEKAGLNVSPRGGIVVTKRLETSDPNIYAGGDCVEIISLITGKPGYWPLGSLANRQGRVIGTNLAGGNAEFEGAVGSFVIKLFDISVASAGLSIESAKKEGFSAISAFVVQFDRAHFYPKKDLMYLELVVEEGTGRVLGIQGLGNTGYGVVGRINAVAPMLKHKIVTEDISNLELAYAPPFSAAMDILNAVANTAENILAGKNRVIEPDTFAEWWEKRDSSNRFFLDCREWGNAEPFVGKYPEHWKSLPQGELRARFAEVPKDKDLVLICNTGIRSYEAQITLAQMGRIDTYNLQGGMAAVKKWGLDLLE